MKTTFIYALCEPDTEKIRYVGKSDRPKSRLSMHIHGSNGYRSHLGHWIKSLISRGLRPKLEVLDEVPHSQWQFWEREYIRVFRSIGLALVNTTDGGDAPPALAGDKNPMFGKPRTEECKKKLRAYSGLNCKLTGRKMPASTCEKHRVAATGVPCSAEKRAKISRSLTGGKRSKESVAKQIAARARNKSLRGGI